MRFAAFKVRKVRFKVSEKAYRDRFRIKGSFSLGEGSDGIDPLDEDVTVTFGGFSETIPAGSFVRFREIITAGEGTAKGFRYQGNVGGVTRVNDPPEREVPDPGQGASARRARPPRADPLHFSDR